MSGSTGIFVWGVKKKLIVANVGDSRAIMLQKDQGNTFKGVALSRDQVPSLQEERDRIEAAGGVIRPSRGTLTISNHKKASMANLLALCEFSKEATTFPA